MLTSGIEPLRVLLFGDAPAKKKGKPQKMGFAIFGTHLLSCFEKMT